MERLIYTNPLGKSVELSVRTNYIMKNIDGTGAVEMDIQSTSSYNQDGENYGGNSLRPRFIDVELAVVANGREDMAKKRQELIKVLNPKLGLGKIEYEYGGVRRRIEGLPEKSPSFVPGNRGKDYIQETLIVFYCPDPYWQELKETKSEIAKWQPSFSFPLSIPEEGIEMGYREPSLIVNVFNGGDVKTGMKIKFRASGTLENPELFSVNTREYFRMNTTMQPGDVITVTTHQFNKRIELERNGVVSNDFNSMHWDSTFLQLDPGDNLFRYDAKDGLDNLEVDIYHTSKSLGV